jgi:hypothetical protein
MIDRSVTSACYLLLALLRACHINFWVVESLLCYRFSHCRLSSSRLGLCQTKVWICLALIPGVPTPTNQSHAKISVVASIYAPTHWQIEGEQIHRQNFGSPWFGVADLGMNQTAPMFPDLLHLNHRVARLWEGRLKGNESEIREESTSYGYISPFKAWAT